MILTDKDIENLDNYWHNQLPETDRQAMENRLKTDADFRKAADEMRLITEGLEVVRLRKMKARLIDLEATLPEIDLDEKEKEKETPVRWLNPRWWAMAATGLVLITAGIWFFNQNALARHEATEGGLKSVAKDYFEAPIPTDIERSVGEDNLAVAARTYLKKEYKKAIVLYQQAFEQKKDSSLLFFKAIAYMGNGESVKAIPILESLTQTTSEKIDREDIDWYLALSYVETAQYDKALPLLNKLENTEGGYKNKAIQLRKVLAEKK